MASKDDIVRHMEQLRAEIEEAVSAMPEDGWSKCVYESGWNAYQLLSHIASMSGTGGFVLNLARMPSAPSLGAGFDEDGFNARLVAEREGRSTSELVGEIGANFARDVAAIRAAPEEVLTKQFRAPWGVEGEVADVIIESLQGHLGLHLADLRSAI
ncbi:MAG: hypothetical protein E6J43_03550 [Chloroflexi bacterium]|nr:MAG: hypothetical protein E6J43_03550 [Chloroflexota bacterium]